jgi:hypothetical protein
VGYYENGAEGSFPEIYVHSGVYGAHNRVVQNLADLWDKLNGNYLISHNRVLILWLLQLDVDLVVFLLANLVPP